MTNYWFMWLPAGMLILLTVLGFNFVGEDFGTHTIRR